MWLYFSTLLKISITSYVMRGISWIETALNNFFFKSKNNSLGALLGNILDNAIEACEEISNIQPLINLKI